LPYDPAISFWLTPPCEKSFNHYGPNRTNWIKDFAKDLLT